ncbi:MAG TPA: hypothetical protein PK105_06025 [Rectinema sp.]|jgi:hypothetical protein|nr:hypothetical protein [Spirochaetia bacterium]MDI9426767.1 hypothetical protein [Spirochaetota bacterium]NLH90768.1 hypothetical protein [Treponema sp.]HNZ93435.1 hypothetical protein [Rectinema sp.]HOC27694.1 hypothetical protein [Rectinema sp.]
MNKQLLSLIAIGLLSTFACFAQNPLPLYGNSAAKADTQLTIESMLSYAIQDEYVAEAEYEAIMEKFGYMAPYSNIKEAEGQHIAWLKLLFTSYSLKVPENNASSYIYVPTTLKEAAETGIRAEIDNIAMYERFLAQPILADPRYADIVAVFVRLRDASKNHLEAFRRQA